MTETDLLDRITRLPSSPRIVIVGGPRRGKSTLARKLGLPVRCADPASAVKDVEPGVTYLPEGLPMAGDAGAAQWVADNWLAAKGPWVCEGWMMARALRRWKPRTPPCDLIVVLAGAMAETSPGQEAMSKGVETVWAEVAKRFRAIVVSVTLG